MAKLVVDSVKIVAIMDAMDVPSHVKKDAELVVVVARVALEHVIDYVQMCVKMDAETPVIAGVKVAVNMDAEVVIAVVQVAVEVAREDV